MRQVRLKWHWAGVSLFFLMGAINLAHSDPLDSCGHASRLSKTYEAGWTPSGPPALGPGSDTDSLHYDLFIEAIPPTREIIGDNTMRVRSLVDGLTVFHFRLRDNYTINSLTLDGRPISFTRESITTVRANFDRAYNAGEEFSLRVVYQGVAVSRGFGSIEFGQKSNGAYFVSTLSEPWYAYTWWPAKDENTDKATINFSITVPNNLVAVSNGLLTSVDSLSGNRSRYNWSHNYPIATYLVSFAATDYRTWTDIWTYGTTSMPVQFYIYPEDDTSGNRTAWRRCLDMLTTFSNLYGLYPFHLEKYGIYQFSFGGGMEHQTISGQGGFGESLTAHELGHQWWGDMITCATWHDIWLNEGFATYSEALWLEKKPGSTGLPALIAAMNDRRPSSVNGTVYRYDISSINTIFSTNFSYRKGAWVLHMLRHILGDSQFFEFLSAYRDAFYMSSATTEDLISVAESVANRNMRWFFDKWVYDPGAPAYTYGWQNTTVNGKTYLMLHIRQTQSTSYGTFTMPIDIRPTVGGNKVYRSVWNDNLLQHYVLPLTGNASSVTLDEDNWILTTSVGTQTYVPGPPKIVETSPAPGGRVSYGLNSIRVTFHTPINAAGSNFEVIGATRGVQSFSYSYDSGSNTVVLTFMNPLLPDEYTLNIADAVTAQNTGQRLDGEITDPTNPNSLPSGNGIQGGNSQIRFKVLPRVVSPLPGGLPEEPPGGSIGR